MEIVVAILGVLALAAIIIGLLLLFINFSIPVKWDTDSTEGDDRGNQESDWDQVSDHQSGERR